MSSCLKNGDPFGVSVTSPCCGTGLFSDCTCLQQEHLFCTEWLSVSPEPNQEHSGRTHSPAGNKTPASLWLSLIIRRCPAMPGTGKCTLLASLRLLLSLWPFPPGRGDGLMNLRARGEGTGVPTACPDIHCKLIITSIFMPTFQDSSGESRFRSPTNGETEVWGDRIMY